MIIRALTISFYLMSLLFFISQADAGEKLLEDWNSISALDAVWGKSDIHDQHIHVMDGELHHLLRPYSTISTSNNLTTFNAFPLSTANNISAFQAKIRIEAIGDISLAPEIELAATDFFGMYYNINTEPTDGVGDIYFVARFGDRGNGLEAWYFLTRIDASDSSAETNLATGNFIPPVGGWQIATDYILSVTYDGANTFVATFGGQPTDISPVVGPARGSSASWAGKSIRTRVRLNGPFTGDADAFAIHTVFDDVHIDTGEGLTLHDDFNAADQSLSTSRWDSTTLVRQSEVTNEMLKMRLKVAEADTVADNGFRYTVGLPPKYQNTDYLQADMKIAGNAMQDTARARVAVGGIFGNGKYTEPGHGNDGAIQFNANVEKKAGSADYRVICNAYMEGLALDAEVEIMWEHVPASPDTWYTATLAIAGNTLQCQIKNTTTGEVVLSASKDVTTVGIASIAPLGETRELFVRDIFAPAEVIGYYDNVYVKDGKGSDINQDDVVDLTDAILALQIVAGLNPAIPRLAFGTDIDGDNKIGLAEAIYALKTAAQLIDTIPPAIVVGPTLSGTTATGTTLAATINENGTGYYLVQEAAVSAPTPATVVAANQSFAMDANVQATVNISGLTSSTAYKIYFVAKDTEGNTQTVVQNVAFTTDFRSGPLNDTGITWGGNYPDGNNTDCTSNIAGVQDCGQGRDATHNDNSDGHAGFNYTKLDANGNNLPADAPIWSCVRDNVTGLVWEVKTDDGGIHDKDNIYRWGGKTTLGSGYGTYYSDWDNLVDGSNNAGFCGYSDWRVPTLKELVGLVNSGRSDPAIDIDYFPNTRTTTIYWSASPISGESDYAWFVYFYYGYAAYDCHRGNFRFVRLVRSEQ